MTEPATKTGLTAPKEGLDARVGREMGREMGWLLRRTKRVEELIAIPEVARMADDLALHMERYAAAEGVELKELEPQVLPSRTKSYITIDFSVLPCLTCSGTGHVGNAGAYCPVCEGAGTR